MAKIWQLNDTLTLFGMETKQFDINFISNNQSFKAIYFTLGASPIMRYLTDGDTQSGITPYSENFKWMGEDDTDHSAYRTITFETEPSGDLLAWLQANAVAQDQPAVTTTRVLYKGKKELTMAQFEALSSLDDAIDYDITDFPNDGITNAQMTAALGYSRLFEDGEIYVCSDNGTYTKGNWYQIKVEGGVKSWEDITKGLKIYTITENLNHDSIKSGTFTEEQINNIKLADILQIYAVDGDPVSKYAYKGLYPTNPAQSTIGANLYFIAATEKGNYVLAINTDTRNWEVREPASGDLQNYVPTQSELSPVALTWTINDTNATAPTTEIRESIRFSVQTDPENIGTNFDTILIGNGSGIQYNSITTGMNHVADFEGNSLIWNTKGADTSAYRTITFETAPSGELLTWLQANAVPQSEATTGSKVYAQITNENGAVSIRVFENEDTDLQNLSITKDGITVNGKKIHPLYKHKLVIPYSFSVTDPTNGTTTVNGSVIYHYLSNTGTQITNASEIDDNFLLSGGIGKNSANTAASQSESTALTWQLNDTLTLFGEETKVFDINFTSNNQSYIGLKFQFDMAVGQYMIYMSNSNGITAYTEGGLHWVEGDAYKTITFETAPTGELLTWLQSNAVPQGGASPITVLLLNINVTKTGSSITVEAVNASTMGYITGTVGTITDTVTQLI